MLVVQGMKDVIAPLENGESLADEFPDRVRLVQVENAAHMLLVEQPEAVAAHIVQFLKEHAGTR